MNAARLAAHVEQYLAERRRLGFDLETMGYALRSLVEHVRRLRHPGALTLDVMAPWARLAKAGRGDRSTWGRRLRLLRPFMRWLRQFDPATPLPEEPVFGRVPGRVAPRIYSAEEINALLEAAGRIGPAGSPRSVVVRTMFGLMACTGMRSSEVLGLADADVDWKIGMLTVRSSKFGRTRLVPLHRSAMTALRHYRAQRDRFVTSAPDAPLFIGCRGRLLGKPFGGRNLERIFDQLRQELNWVCRGGRAQPRLHDLRHTFAVRRLQRWHEDGADMHHLSAVPELMQSVGTRFEHFVTRPEQAEYDDE